MTNTTNNRQRITAQKAAHWLVTVGGMDYKELGACFGKSNAWAHHIAKGNWKSKVVITPEQAYWLRTLVHVLKAQSKASRDELAMIDEIKTKLGVVISDVDNLARRLARRKIR